MAASHDQWSKLRQSPRDWRILRWIRRKPIPASVKGVDDDGEDVVTTLEGTGRTKWTDAVRVLHNCEKLSALDAKGRILRVLELDPDDPELRAELEREQAAKTASSGRAEIISIDVPRLVDNIASNMKDVASAAAAQQATAFREGFQAMTSVVNLCLQLLVNVEARLNAAQDTIATTLENAESSAPNTRDQLVQMALQKALGNGTSGFNPAALEAILHKHTNGGNGAAPSIDLNAVLQFIQQQQAGGEDHGGS